MSFDKITIVITSFRSEKKIIKCLESIKDQCKVIIIENSKNHLLKIELENKFKNVKCIIPNSNLGYAKGNNLGLSKVKTEFALILNPDAELTTDSLKNFFITANALKDFAIIGPGNQYHNKENNLNKLINVDSVKGFAMFIKIAEFKTLGFFDENFFIYLEETDLCKRVIENGKKIYLDNSIEIMHQGGSSHDKEHNFEMELSRNWHWMWSLYYFNKKHYGTLKALIHISDKFITALLKYLFYLFILKKKKKLLYKQRLLGLWNSIIGQTSFYRPFE